MLTSIGLLNGLTGLLVLSALCLFGAFTYYKARKTNAKMLAYISLVIIFIGLFHLGQAVDLIVILSTGKNINPPYLYGILCYMWTGPAIIVAMYVFLEILNSKKKRLILMLYVVLAILFEFLLFLDTKNSFNFDVPKVPGEYIIDSTFVRSSPVFFLIAFFLLSMLAYSGIGLVYKAVKSEGVIRRKYFLLSIGFIIFVVCATLDSMTSPGPILFVVRIGMMSTSIFYYLGLKEEQPEKPREPPKKEVEVEENLFRIAKKPATLTEEEVVYYKEQEICLVCKGKAMGFNVYVCPKCKALYCRKCALALSDLENACWSCNGPIDHTKPVKSQETEDKINIYSKSVKNEKKFN